MNWQGVDLRVFSRLGASEAAHPRRPLQEVAMKTQGEIEAAICEGINRFQQEYLERSEDQSSKDWSSRRVLTVDGGNRGGRIDKLMGTHAGR